MSGGDRVGAMYGVLDLAEQLALTRDWGQIKPRQRAPFIEKRGIKFNIPLDGRSPSYDDTGDAAQQNILQMWSLDFWHEYIDQLARDRYNVLSLWTKHPFPHLIKLEDYPAVAMDDVYTLSIEITPELHKDWRGVDLLDPANLKLVKRMTIDEKIAFWQHVMRYAHDRGIETYVYTWNAFVTGAEKYGIDTNKENAIPYMRQCVKQFVLTYPHLAGIGVTAGERMNHSMAGRSKVRWLYETYGQGICDALAIDKARSVRFIFRQTSTNLQNILDDFVSEYSHQVETSYKYSKARQYTSTTPPFYELESKDLIESSGLRCWMNIRNDDIFCFRWGDPQYARDYLRKMERYEVAGFFIGSDGYVWGREFTSKNPAVSGQLEVKKHWYREMLWGRLAFDPELDKNFFLKRLSNRFEGVDPEALYDLWHASSQIIPTVQRFHFKPADYQWHVEGCISVDGFVTIREFIDCPTFDSERIMTIPEYARALAAGESDSRTTPFDIADSLHDLSASCLSEIDRMNASVRSTDECKETLADIEAMAWLGEYYAWKIRAAAAFYFYETNPDQAAKAGHKRQTLEHLQKAREAWATYADNADSRYKTQLLARTTYLDWKSIGAATQEDNEIVEASNGEQPKYVKIFVAAKSRMGRVESLKQTLTENGYTPREYPFHQLDSYANFHTRIVLFGLDSGEKEYRRFVKEGATLPEEVAIKGYAVVKHNNIYWLIGKDFDLALKAAEEMALAIGKETLVP